LKQLEQNGKETQYIILNSEAISYIDSSAVFMLRQLINHLKRQNVRLIIAGSIGPTRDILYKTQLIDDIGKENLFVKTNEAFEHCMELSQKSAIEEKISLQYKNNDNAVE